MNIINISDLDPHWNWLEKEFKNDSLEWLHYSSQSVNIPKFLPKKNSIARAATSLQAIKKSKTEKSILVSHGARPAYYCASLAKIISPDIPQLAYSFNFTNLPKGMRRSLMAKSYIQIKKFVTYSTVERTLYAEYFDIPIESIDMLHWSVNAPNINIFEEPIENGRYICALGSQGRDYETLFLAMKKNKNIKLVVVTTLDSIKNLEIPDNVKIHINISLNKTHNILINSQFMVLPLRDNKVPCGHVTIVSGMFFKKPIIVTNSIGVHDYIQDEKTGLFFDPKNPIDLSNKIQYLWDDSFISKKLGESGFLFANNHCTEKTAVNYFTNFIKNYFY